MKISNLVRTLIALGLTAGTLTLPSQAQTSVKWWSITAPSSTVDSCQLVRNEVALESELKKLGWARNTNDFPQIDWTTNYASIVRVTDKHATPLGVKISASNKLVVLVRSDSTFESKGLEVAQVGRGYGLTEGCTVSLASFVEINIIQGRRSGGSQTIESSPSSSER
jgi:hypothetical protein